ncbi:MAG: CPBP family intramembrane glutamic endopeptidase [Candidatus Micrarchaeia archaeon]
MLEEWEDSPETNKVLVFLILGAVVILLWASVTFEQPGLEEQARWADKFIVMLLVVAAFGLIDQLKENNLLGISFAGLGESIGGFTAALLIGGFVGFVMINVDINVTGFSIISGVLASTLFSIFAAPIVEELFFRGLLFHTLSAQTKNEWAAMIATSVIFGLFHILAHGGDLASIATSALFSMVCILGNGKFKTLGFGIGAHLMNNGLLSGGLG